MCNGKRSAYEALDQFFHAYLVERDLEKTLSLLTEDLYSLGTGAEEVAVSQAEFAALLREQFSALPGRDRIFEALRFIVFISIGPCRSPGRGHRI